MSNPAQKLTQAETKTPLDPMEQIPDYLEEYRGVFDKAAASRFLIKCEWDHEINLKPDFIPKWGKVYPLSPKEQEQLDLFLKENLEKGYIWPSSSPMASPFFFIGKKDGNLCPCQDYHFLNEGMVKNLYPLSLISDLLDKVKKAKIFTKLNLYSGYNNVRIKEGHQWKATFTTNWGLYEPMVMFFGLCNSPVTFQAMMNSLFADMIDKGWIVIYMDDILIFSKNFVDHRKCTSWVLQHLKKNNLFLKLEKCFFDVSEVEFLGMILHPGQLTMDPAKLKGIANWPAPTSLMGV